MIARTRKQFFFYKTISLNFAQSTNLFIDSSFCIYILGTKFDLKNKIVWKWIRVYYYLIKSIIRWIYICNDSLLFLTVAKTFNLFISQTQCGKDLNIWTKNFYCFHIEISLISSQVYVETLFNHDSLFFPFHIIVSYITNIQLCLNFLYTKLLAFIFTRFNIRKLLSNKPRPIIQVSLFSSRLNKILFIA